MTQPQTPSPYADHVDLRADGRPVQGRAAVGYATPSKDQPLAPYHFQRREVGASDVGIEILYCGVCHSDLHQARDEWGNTVWPCLPGHEIVGRVSAVGEGVTRFGEGDLVGVGCMVGSCQECASCRAGEEQYCEKGFLATYNGPFTPDGSNTFGGYSDYVVVTEKFVLPIPEGLEPQRAAPILCAGVTVYSPMKHWGVGPGKKVGVVGLGGLGHMAVQIAAALGAEVTAFSTREDKLEDARRLGAGAAVLSTDQGAMEGLATSLDFILNTIPSGHDVGPYLQRLAHDGHMVVVGALEELKGVNNMSLAKQRLSLAGSLIGSLTETQEVLELCARHGLAAQAEVIAIGDVNAAYERMMAQDIHYRAVIDMATLRGER